MLILFILLATFLQTQIPLEQASVQAQKNMQIIHTPAMSLTEKFDDSINQWMEELAEQDEFADWKSSTIKWDRQPIGPGLHGWVVIITDQNKELGYLVVTVDAEGEYHLSEYGHGPYPLFSENTLYHSMVQHELIDSSTTIEEFLANSHLIRERIYLSPLQSIWVITSESDAYQLDAKTGDLMSIDVEILGQLMSTGIDDFNWTAPSSETRDIRKSLQLPAFDPYVDMGWIVKPPSKLKDLQQLQASLHSGKSITYVIDLYMNTVVYALSVTGYHQWNAGEPFISIDQNGARYISAQLLMQSGRYYVS